MATIEYSDADHSHRNVQRHDIVSDSLFSVALIFLTLIMSTTSLSADELIIAGAEKISDENSRRSALYGTQDPSNPLGEDIDLMSGNLGFSHTDLVLRGNGPEIVVTRIWSASRNTNYYNHARHTGSLQDWDLAVPEIETSLLNQDTSQSLWKVVGPSPLSRCTNFGEPVSGLSPQFWWRGVRLKVPGQPEQMLVHREATNSHVPGGQIATYPIVTNNNWAISCLATTKNNDGGQGFLAISPKGDKYWFDWYSEQYFGDIAAYYGAPLNLTNQAPSDMTVSGIVAARLRVTRIEDRYGNYLLYTYLGGDISRIEASDGRFVDFLQEEMDPAGVQPYKRITGVQYSNGNGGLQQITYQYEQIRYEDPIRIHRQLKTVTYPDGASWVLNMFSANGICRYQKPPIQTFAYSCYPSSYTGMAGAQVSVRSPGGLNADYIINHAEAHRWAENCPYYGRMQGSNPQCLVYPIEPNANYAPKISRKTYSGPGIQNQIWSYNYIASSTTPSTAVTNPDGSIDVYKFGAYNKYSADEGVLLALHEGAVLQGGEVLSAQRTTTYQYSQGQKIGTAPQRFVNRSQTEYLRGLNKRVIEESGTQYVYEVTSRDGLFRPTTTVHSNPNRSRTETVEYFDDAGRWVLGQSKRKSVDGIESNYVEFDASSMPWKMHQFGKLRETVTYDMSSIVASGQRGTVATVTDGRGATTVLSNWKRGIPQQIVYPATADSPSGTTRSAVVNDLGWVISTTDENGSKTCYGHDAMGRITSIKYPSETQGGVCDASAWLETSIEFRPLTAVEWRPPGVEAGQWRQYTYQPQGNYQKLVYLDAMWRPVLTHEYDSSNMASLRSSSMAYDSAGRVIFQSYPSSDLVPAATGIWSEYDALDRVVKKKQNSEQGDLITKTEYLPGSEVRVTNPKDMSTTTSFQVFDQPAFDFPVLIVDPRNTSTEVVRDVFGKPLEIIKR